ncbi:MAG: class II fructose-bisphosphate aldolase [Lachnospiraceae bacterium]|nr:class II fructose-bisphosphate aldolase [Lachnospiraceae bacterium]
MLVTSKEMFEEAQKGGYAIPAANMIDYDTAKWHVEVAEVMGMPLILGICESHMNRLVDLEEAARIALYLAKRASVPVVVHLDHGETVETAKKAVDLGFSSVMLDASTEPFGVNVERTKEVVTYAHARGVMVEAEIGHVGTGGTYASRECDNIYTRVEEATSFVEQTEVDSLAVSIGTAHGLYKGNGIPKINFDRLHELRNWVKAPLVLHGGSSSGDENLHRCATEGIVKINIYSDLIVSAAKEVLALPLKEVEEPDYYKIKEASRRGMQNCLRHCYEVFATHPIK